jgi:exodeoxyribonuclease V beta subunit
MGVRIDLPPPVSTFHKVRSFLRNPGRFIARRLFRFSLSAFGIGISFGLGGLRLFAKIPFGFISINPFRRKGRGKGRGSKGGSSKSGSGESKGGKKKRDRSGGPKGDSSAGGPKSSGGDPKSGGGGEESGGRDGGESRDGASGGKEREQTRGERARNRMQAARDRLRQRRRESREREDEEIRQNDPRLKRERAEREAQEQAERQRRQAEQQRQQAEREAQERAQRAARQQAERERAERDARDQRERAQRQQREAQEQAERREREAREQAERQQRESRERADKARSEERERGERAAAERRARAEAGVRKRREAAQAGSSDGQIRPSGSEFELSAPLAVGCRVVLEASAGTGKTFSLTSLVARYVAEKDLTVDELLMVTFTKAAAAEMRERTRAKLGQAVRAIEGDFTDEQMGGDKNWLAPIVRCNPDERAERIRRLRAAVSEIDSATITTIHGFFQQTLKEIGLKSADVATAEIGAGEAAVGRQVVRDELIRRYSSGDTSLSAAKQGSTPADVEKQVLEIVRALDSNISATAAPSEPSSDAVANTWAEFVSETRRTIHQRRVDTGALSFDDLITEMYQVINRENPLSEAILATLRARYRLVLIDEFQDTDDMQWEIFSRIFDVEQMSNDPSPTRADKPFLAMIMVGDPKQAIYRFRGADIAAYLRAVSDPNIIRYEMKRNFRSDADLISAVNRLFGAPVGADVRPSGFKFGNSNIAYIQVDAGKKGSGSLLAIDGNPQSAKPLQLRWVPSDEKPTVDVVRPAIAEDLANHVTLLLNDGTISEHKDGEVRQRPVKPGDICVLIRSHGDADPVVDALRSRSIPVVKSSVGNVTASPAVEQWRLLLSAIAAPNDSRRVKAAGLSWFVGLAPEKLLDEEPVIQLAERCAVWAAQLVDLGVMGFYQQLRADPEVADVLYRSSDVDRRLTDLEHLAELLHRATSAKPLPAASLLRALEDLAASSTEEEENLRRIESDAEAVQVMTMHASKGLEFPIVLVPYPKAPNNRGTSVYTHEDQRFVDAAPDVEWALGDLNQDLRKAIAAHEVAGDELRIMYVAYTRARHQLVLWWANTRGMAASPLARLLFGNHDDLSAKTAIPKAEGAKLEAVIAHVGESLAHLTEVPLRGVAPLQRKALVATADEVGNALAFPANARSRFSQRRWSFSGIAQGLNDTDHDDATGGGRDEGSDDALPGDAPAGAQSTMYANEGLFPMPANADFGTLVHAVLEHVDPTSASVRDDLQLQITRFGGELLNKVNVTELADGLIAALQTPMGPFFGNTKLADISAVDRLPEMDFHFSLCPATQSASSRAIALAAAADHDSPFASYFSDLAAKWGDGKDQHLRGLMTGSIDALLRIGSGGRPKFFVVDYKSNKLSFERNPLDHRAYGQDNMRVAMEHHHYPLQALLYCVALHRFLSARIADYDITRDLGGAGYLFIRGMVGPSTPLDGQMPNGVFAWRPSNDTIVRVNQILEEGQP